MPHYSPYGNHLARLWPIASLVLLALSLALGIAVIASVRIHLLELFLTASIIPAAFAVLLASNGYGILSPHDGRMTLRIWLAASGAIVFVSGMYVAFGFARNVDDDAIVYFLARALPYMAIVCLMGLGIMRLSTRLRHSRRPSDAVAVAGATLIFVSVGVSLWLGTQGSGLSLLVAMLVGVPPLGLSLAVTTYALRQSGRERAAFLLGTYSAIAIAAMGLIAAVWFSRVGEKDYLYGILSIALTPLSLSALNWRIARQLSPWPIWASVAAVALAVAMGLWAAIDYRELVDIFLFSVPDMLGSVNGFGWIWLAKALPSAAIALYAIFCIEEPWQWHWEWMRSRRAK